MSYVWFLVIFTLNVANSDENTIRLMHSNAEKYNTEEACRAVGKAMSETLKETLPDTRVFYSCHKTDMNEVFKAILPPT